MQDRTYDLPRSEFQEYMMKPALVGHGLRSGQALMEKSRGGRGTEYYIEDLSLSLNKVTTDGLELMKKFRSLPGRRTDRGFVLVW